MIIICMTVYSSINKKDNNPSVLFGYYSFYFLIDISNVLILYVRYCYYKPDYNFYIGVSYLRTVLAGIFPDVGVS